MPRPPFPCPWNGAHARRRPLATHAATVPPQSPRRNRLVAVVQVSAVKDVGQFVGPESGANVELKRGDEQYLRRGDVEHLVRRGDLVHILP